MGFYTNFSAQINAFIKSIATEKNEWIIKGFIDIYKRIYPMTSDTKVVSKIIELMLFPEIVRFGDKFDYEIFPAEEQNHYPDISFKNEKRNELIAVDIKSTYRKNSSSINGMTLGAFTGYFRSRDTTKNIRFPYNKYSAHYVLGVIYTRNEQSSEVFSKEMKNYELNELLNVPSVVSDFQIFLQEKWRIASDKPGSGNTKNIGSTKNIQRMVEGRGIFSKLGKEAFDDYWTNYLTNDMAKAIDSNKPYTNINEYLEWRNKIDLDGVDLEEIRTISKEDSVDDEKEEESEKLNLL